MNIELLPTIVFYISLLVLIPFWIKLFVAFGRLIIIKFFPPEYITLMVKQNDGKVTKQKIKIKDNEALVQALLSSKEGAIDGF